MRKLISAHNLVVSSYELDPMLEEKYQTLKQNICNEIATCEIMLEPATGQSSDHDDDMGEAIEKPLVLKVTPSMDPIEREFRERLDSMDRDDEVPTYIDPKTINERDFYYLLIKRHRTVSDIELLNHMYGAVQAIGNLDVDTMDRYQVAKRKGTRIIQKCNELLDAVKKKTDNSSQELKESPTDDIPKKLPKKDSAVNQESLMPVSNTQNRTAPKGGFENIRSSKKRESSIKPIGGFGICPDSGERGQEREEVLKAVQEITKGNEEVIPIQNSRDTAPYLRGENSHFKSGWEGLEQPNGRYDLKGRDLSWDYSDANISYEGSYLVATSGSNGDVIVTRRGKSRGGRQIFRANSTQTPHGNKTSVSVDKETQMTPQKANTPLKETIWHSCTISQNWYQKEKEEKVPQKITIIRTHRTRSLLCPYNIINEYLLVKGGYYYDDEPFFIFRDRRPVRPYHVRTVLHRSIKSIGLDHHLNDPHSLCISRAKTY